MERETYYSILLTLLKRFQQKGDLETVAKIMKDIEKVKKELTNQQ